MPLVAIIRRLARGFMPSNASVHLVVVVRETCTLEQLLDGRLLPVDAEGNTAFTWLRTEIHLTAKRPVDPGAIIDGGDDGGCGVSVEEAGSEESAETTNGERRVLASCLHPSSPERAQTSGKSAVRDSAQHGPSEENSEAHVSGPFRAGLLLDGTLHVSAAPLPPLLPSPPANVPLPVYEALSLLGSTAGLLLIAWPLSWSDSEAPWARQMASTSVTGGGMFVVATGSSCFLAAVLLWMTDFAATLLVIVQGRRSIATEVYKALNFLTRARTSVMKVEDSSGPVALDQEPATSVASTDAAQISIKEERSLGAFVPVAGRTRPDMQALLHRTPEGARIAVGGPPSMLSALGKELSKAGRPPFTRLTHAL